MDPETLLTFYPDIKRRLYQNESADHFSPGEKHLDLLIKYLDTEHRPTLLKIQTLQDHLEVTYDLLWYILVPRTILYLPCPISGEPRAAMLVSANKQVGGFGEKFWNLSLEYTESSGGASKDGSPAIGLSTISTTIRYFNGAKKITALPTFPLHFHPQAAELEERLIERGRKWAQLNECHHMRYDGVAYENNIRYTRVKVSTRMD